MSPAGRGELSLTKFYRLPELISELGSVEPGMTRDEVGNLLGRGHKELADDLVLYADRRALEDPLLSACRANSTNAPILLWVALVMADHRLASAVEGFLTDAHGKLIPDNFDTERLEAALAMVLPGTTRKSATNILSYYRDSGLIEPLTRSNTIVGISEVRDTSHAVPSVISYVGFRLRQLSLADEGDSIDLALRVGANSWINLTPGEFRGGAPAEGSVGPALGPRGRPSRRASPHRATAPRTQPETTQEVPVEAHITERFRVSAQAEREAERREQPLVQAYERWMRARGSVIVRLRRKLPDGNGTLLCDIYDTTRNNLIEAKGSQARWAIRMAIGQLFDYRRYTTQPDPGLAVLTPNRPRRDLEVLLHTAGIYCVWRQGTGFIDNDNASGRFV